MNKLMSLEVLSNIKGAKSSDSVESLIKVIKDAQSISLNNLNDSLLKNAVEIEALRKDEVHESSDIEKKIIRANFPLEKNGYLVVSKVMED